MQWPNEQASIARSLVLHHAFAEAYRGYDGPTAWLAPGYPFLVAVVFWMCGIASRTSAVVLLLLNVVVSSLTGVMIYKLGRECLTEKVGLIAGWAWALSPLGALMPLMVWDTALSALMLSTCILALLRANSVRHWAAAGLLWGATALVNPSLLAPLPAIVISRLWRVPRGLRIGTVFCLTLISVLLPWTVRNRLELHSFFPIRSNGWAEIYFGNVSFGLHPHGHSAGLYQQLGEARFVEQLKHDAIQYIVGHPGQFAWASLQRVIRFWLVPVNFWPLTLIEASVCWIGVALLLRNFGRFAIPMIAVPLFYPLVFSITHVEARYRHPIEPIVYLLAAYAGCELYCRFGERIRGRQGHGSPDR